MAVLTEQEVLGGGTVLPEFTLSLRELFAVLDHLDAEGPTGAPTA